MSNKGGICPKCGKEYTERPALSRVDNETLICPDCGIREAMENVNASEEKIQEVLELRREAMQDKGK